MTTVISMLRGVNVGGHNMIKMEILRALYESMELRDPQTYVQSGNVIFKTEERNLAQLVMRIEEAIEGRFGIRPTVIVRTSSEMKGVIARNPFAKRSDIDPRRLLVLFLAGDASEEARDNLLRMKADPEELRIG